MPAFLGVLKLGVEKVLRLLLKAYNVLIAKLSGIYWPSMLSTGV